MAVVSLALQFDFPHVVIATEKKMICSLPILTLPCQGDGVPAGYTSSVELCLGFLVVSIPAYRSLATRQLRRRKGSQVWAWHTSRRRSLLGSTENPYSTDQYKANGHRVDPFYGSQRLRSAMQLRSMGGELTNSHDDGMGHTTLVATSQTTFPTMPDSVIFVTDHINQIQMSRIDAS